MRIKKNIAISESGFVFDAGSGDSYSMNKTGREILLMLQNNKSETDIKSHIIEKYDVEANTFENNFYDFVNILNNFNLVENEK